MMEEFDARPGTNKLADVLCQRMKQESKSPLVLDFGWIQTNGSLITRSFPRAIPKGEYSVCRQLTLGNAGEYLSCTDEKTPAHSVVIPEKMRSVGAGDCVLVAWVENEAVVVDIIAGT